MSKKLVAYPLLTQLHSTQSIGYIAIDTDPIQDLEGCLDDFLVSVVWGK